MMQIAKVSLFLAGSAAFTSAVRVTSRGRRMQPTDDTPNTAAQMANSIDGVNWAANANKEDMKAMWNDFKQYVASKKPEFDNSKATQFIADSMVNTMDSPNWMACQQQISKDSSSLQTEDKMSTNDQQVAKSLVHSVGSGFDIGTGGMTPSGFKLIAMEFLNQKLAQLDSVSPATAASLAHGNQEAAANYLACGAMASQWPKQQTADKAINKGDQQEGLLNMVIKHSTKAMDKELVEPVNDNNRKDTLDHMAMMSAQF